MKATQTNSSKSNDRKNTFKISLTDNKQFSYFTPQNYNYQFQEENNYFLNQPMKNILENGGRKSFVPEKRTYKDLFISNINNFPQNINNNTTNLLNTGEFNTNSINYSFYNEPSLINKIRRDENLEDNINNMNESNIDNNNLNNNNIKDGFGFMSNNNLKKKNEEEEKKENDKKSPEKKFEKQKKIIDEYSVIEKVLKEEQNLFLEDKYHVSNSREYEQLKEESSSYIISKRVNFPNEFYQNDNSGKIDFNANGEEDNYTIVYPPLNCIIVVKKNKICFFNYINENVYSYTDLSKPVKKLLITVPKPEIFINDIKFIMICVVEGEILILTLTFKNSENDFPIIHKTDFIFSFNETVLDLVSTSNHRIFMSTVNNKIYELDYTIKQNNYFNFFGTRTSLEAINKEKPMFFGLFADLKFIFQQSIEIIQKLKVDNTRNILYAIKYTVPKSEKFSLDIIIDSSILIFDLGVDGNDFNKIQEISQEDLCDYGYEFNGYNNFNYLYSERDINENNYIIEKSNIIIDIEPLTRDKFKDYHLLVIKRNGHKLFLKFNTFLDDSILPNQDKILKFNNSAFCRERITDRFISVLKKIPNKLVNKRNNPVLYEMINYFPFSTFCFYKNNPININGPNDPNQEYILKVVEDNFNEIAKKENIRFGNQNEGLKETEQILFRTTSSTSTKKLCSVIKLSDYNIEDTCGLGNLLKNSSKNYNMKYIDNNNNGLMDAVSYNCMTEYSKQLFYPPEEFALLFNDEFVIYKRLRPIDTLIEIMKNKNINNNISDEDNFSDINTNYDNNIITNEINGSNSNVRRNKKSMPFLFGNRNRLNNPLQINRELIIFNKFKEFINKHGYIETSVMLLNIITNNNFYYYIKNCIENPNNMANNINIISSFSNNIEKDQINILRNDLYYLNPYSLIKAKNDNQLMNLSQEFLMKLFICAKEDIDIQIIKYQNLLQNILQNLNDNKELISQNNNYRYQFNNSNFNNTNMKNSTKYFEGKNFMSYSFILYLSRIIRLFWEENIYIRNKKYYQKDNFEFNIINNMNQNQIMFIKNMLIKFINTINQYKIEFLQQASDITTKSNKLKNYLNDIDKFLNSNSGYVVNEVKKRLNFEEQNILTYHKKNISYFISIFNFEKFSNDLDEIINISKRVIEILNFVDSIYKININRELEKRKSYSILDVKIKDLFRGNYPFVINELLQIIFEVYIKEKNMDFASIKIQEIIQQCPDIVNENDANAIEGNFILKFCKYNQMDNIDKIKYIKQALEKINLNLLSVKIEEVVNYLSKFQDLTNIINLCLKKGKILKDEVNLKIDHNRRNILDIYNANTSLFNTNDNDDDEEDSKSNKKDIKSKQIENNETEFYNCIRIILDILDYLHNSIVYDSFENYIKIKSPNANIFSFPEYIYNLLSNRTPDEYRRMELHILNLVFNEQYEYIHYNIIDFLKHNNLMNILQEINSPSIEKYLNNEININNNSVQSLFSMFNFYFRNKNYSCATKILANLVNYTNPSSNFTRNNALNGSGEINSKNYVTLDDRITYVNTMLRTLDLQIQDAEYIQLPEQKMNEIQEAKTLKEKMINIRNILKIQQEIKNYLISYLENYNSFNENNVELEEEFKAAIILLDFEKIDLNNLYNKYAKKFSIFDSCISIFFQLKFSNSNSKVDPKEIRRIYCEYFCKLDDMTLSSQWPNINFERFNRIFNSLIKEKTQYQNFYNMLQNNGMKNKYRDIIPLEFIIAIIESMNRKIIFNNDKFIEGDNYLMKLRQDYKQPENPFWLILYLRDQIYLPLSFIFNEYYIIYISLSKENISKFIPNISNTNSDLRSNLMSNNDLSMHTFNTNNFSIFNNSNFEEYGMVFDGNLNGDISRQRSKDAKFYILFLLLGIEKLWINRLFDILNNRIDTNVGEKRHSQDELDLKQFYLEFKKNGNQKLKNLIKEFYEELKNCRLIYSENKCIELKNYGNQIEENLKDVEDKVSIFYSNKIKKDINKNNMDISKNNINNNNINIIKSNDNKEKLLQVNFVGEDKKNYFGNHIPFSNNYNSEFINLMPYK